MSCSECVRTPCGKMCVASPIVAVAALTLLVIGILGMQGKIPMAPVGGKLMVVLGVGMMLGMIASVIGVLKKSENPCGDN